MSNIAIIPARGNSQRIPRKNIKEFHGKPIIAYSIDAARDTNLFDHIIVSTDDDEIALVAEVLGAKIHMRDPFYGRNEVGTQAVMRECLLVMGMSSEDRNHVACCIYATSPLMSINDLNSGYVALCEDRAVNYAFSVGRMPLQDAGQFYWGRASCFVADDPLVSKWSRMVPVDDKRVCDINTVDDWNRALLMYEDLHNA